MTEPQQELGCREIYWPRGKVAGRSSSINAMMWGCGFDADYTSGAKRAGLTLVFCPMLWILLPSQIENFTTRGTSSRRRQRGDRPGSQSPVNARPAGRFPPRRGWSSVRGAVFFLPPPRPNSARPEGFLLDSCPHAAPGTRYTLRRRVPEDRHFAKQQPHRALRGDRPARILIDKSRSVGVEFQRGEQLGFCAFTREVCFCGGAVNSPQLLSSPHRDREPPRRSASTSFTLTRGRQNSRSPHHPAGVSRYRAGSLFRRRKAEGVNRLPDAPPAAAASSMRGFVNGFLRRPTRTACPISS